jgi:hypothetical protein
MAKVAVFWRSAEVNQRMFEPSGPASSVSPLLSGGVLVACLTGAVTAAGWFVTKRLDLRAQTKLKEAEFRRGHIQKQIEEFYGPLYSLVWQIFAINDLKDAMLRRKQIDPATKIQIDDYFATKYFLPMHAEVRGILETKLYLVEGTRMPDSFQSYLRAALQETVQRELWSSSGIDTSFVKGAPWPAGFYEDIHGPLMRLMAEYETDVQLLRGANTPSKAS